MVSPAVTAPLARLLPPACLAACGRPAQPAVRGPSLGLCRRCRGRLAPFPRHLCPACLGHRPGPAGLCPSCRRAVPYADLLALWLYRPPLTELLRRYKFGGLEFLGSELADCVAAELAGRLAPSLEAVTAVPLHWWRRLRRGFDQAESVARPLALRLGLPFLPLLGRRLPTGRQARLGRAARRRNLRGAFSARHGPPPRHLLLVDDVVTTGATAEAAVRALLTAGALTVRVLCVARTPPGGPGAAAARRS